MPLYKRKPFLLLEPPKDLDPRDEIFQVRFTKEIFKNYENYLNRLNIYRQRIWTCKITGKINLTYEEALVSENRATEKVQQIPEVFIVPILQIVQFSTLNFQDLVNTIHAKLQKLLYEGVELNGKKDESVCTCKILKILDNSQDILYEVGWLDENKKVIHTSTVTSDYLAHKKPPVSKIMLKSFIRESSSQSCPWIVREKLAQKHRLPIELPKELCGNLNGNIRGCKTKEDGKNRQDGGGKRINNKRKNINLENPEGLEEKSKKLKKGENEAKKCIKYPIEDHLVEPAADDPIFTDRPSPSRDFKVPMDCVGDLLMVWDFCSSFKRILNLWPFSLEDFEKAICDKESSLVLIMETHSAILSFLMKDGRKYYMAVQKKKRKSKITRITWTDYLCDFLDIRDKSKPFAHLSTIKRGHYGLLDVHVKLKILHELVTEALITSVIREKLDEYIEQHRALMARKREESRLNKESNHLKKEESTINLETSSIRGNHKYDENGLPNGIEEHKPNGNYDVQNRGKKLEVYSKKISNKQKESSSKTAHKVDDSIKSKESKKKENMKDVQSLVNSIGEQKKEIFEKEVDRKLRKNSLGNDRDYNRYWFFQRDGRLFIESSDSKNWGYYTTKEELDAFMGSLNPKGERESALKIQLEKQYTRISAALQKRCKNIAQRTQLEDTVVRRSTRVQAQPRDNPATAFRRFNLLFSPILCGLNDAKFTSLLRYGA